MNIVFLDIDGVLQPLDSEFRFYNNDDNLIKELSNKFNTDYSIYNYFDVAAVYYDWDEQAVSRLKYILDETNSKLIISSNWRSEKLPNKMKDLLKIQYLDKYYFKDNIYINELLPLDKLRSMEINKSLEMYDINNFVVLDDMFTMKDFFPDNAVITHDSISINNMNECIKILKKMH